jgi:dihydroxyacetone kinase phosphoprotein-dependent L subunit
MTDTKKRLELTVEQTKEMFQFVGEKVIASKPRLTEIDSAIGDGDHGIGMSVGFKKAIENLNQKELPTINEVFKTIGMSMISSMGGASGIIFGTMFVGGVKGLEEHKTLNLQTLATIFEKSLEAIKTRGKADLGDKTMIDALQPAVLSLNNSNYSDLSAALQEAAAQANAGVERTKEFIAKFGRAKTLGERAIGHQDAGATTVAIIFEAMSEWVEGNVE